MRIHAMKAAAVACMLGAGCGGQPQESAEETRTPAPTEVGESEAKLENGRWYRVCWEAAGLYHADRHYASDPPIPVNLYKVKTFHAGHKVYQYYQVWFTGGGDATSPAWYSYTGDSYGNFGYIRTAALCYY